jgi:hypothetical protein
MGRMAISRFQDALAISIIPIVMSSTSGVGTGPVKGVIWIRQ